MMMDDYYTLISSDSIVDSQHYCIRQAAARICNRLYGDPEIEMLPWIRRGITLLQQQKQAAAHYFVRLI
jgi:hypothetical protein